MVTDFWTVDTFCDKPLRGIPATVFFVDDLSDENLLQDVAMEINSPESIFLRDRKNGTFESVCYTPTAKGLFFGNSLYAGAKVIHSKTNLNQFSITCGIRVFAINISDDERIEVRFSTVDLAKSPTPLNLSNALNGELVVSLAECKGELIVELRSPSRLQDLQANMDMLKAIDYNSFALTTDTHYETNLDYDFCLKVFAPKLGIYRAISSPIACAKLSAYWISRIGKNELTASGIGEERFYIKHENEFTYISGYCSISTQGSLLTKLA